jgi:hypothetical protein
MLGGRRHLGEGPAIVGVAVSCLSLGAFWIAMRRVP